MKWTDAHHQLVKWSSTAEALTDSQRAAMQDILNAIEAGVPYIDLFGKPGSGKTFPAKHLANTQQCIYLSSPSSQPPATVAGRCVLIDNVGLSRHEVRSTCNEMLSRGAQTAVVITQERVLDSFTILELKLTTNDEAFVYEQIAKRRPALARSPGVGSGSGLWPLVASYAESDSQ